MLNQPLLRLTFPVPSSQEWFTWEGGSGAMCGICSLEVTGLGCAWGPGLRAGSVSPQPGSTDLVSFWNSWARVVSLGSSRQEQIKPKMSGELVQRSRPWFQEGGAQGEIPLSVFLAQQRQQAGIRGHGLLVFPCRDRSFRELRLPPAWPSWVGPEGAGVAAVGCTKACQGGMINEQPHS